MKKTSKKTVTVRKQLKIKLENTLTRRKNARNFRPTHSIMVTWFKHLNKGLFGNKLPAVPLYLVRMNADWGRCWANWDNRKCRKGTYDQSVIPYDKTEVTFRNRVTQQVSYLSRLRGNTGTRDGAPIPDDGAEGSLFESQRKLLCL